MTFIEWCIVNKKDKFLDQMDEAKLREGLSDLYAVGKDIIGLLSGRKPFWYSKLQSDKKDNLKRKRVEMRHKQANKPATKKKQERRIAIRAELGRRKHELNS